MQTLDFGKDYFHIFGLAVDYRVDENLLKARQRQLQAEFHPDLFVNASDQVKRLSVQQAAHVNEAYQTLLNPVSRAKYLLEINGLESSDESETTSDTEFLMEQLAYREALEQCRDDSDPLTCCDKILDSLEARAGRLADEFVEKLNTADLGSAREVSRKMQFVQRIREQATELQYELEDQLA